MLGMARLYKSQKGWIWSTKLKDTNVVKIRQLYDSGNYTTIKLAKMYNVHRSTISYIVNNKTFKHLLED
jgi:DNA-binding XRE family transcriptional regulator